MMCWDSGQYVYQIDLLYTQANNQPIVPNPPFQTDDALPQRHLAPLDWSELRRERARGATQMRPPIALTSKYKQPANP
ncbi:MAG: hypothetical protein ACI8XO_002170 [Verrucomicrobiales bacterium]|jgi:hypothetical protein